MSVAKFYQVGGSVRDAIMGIPSKDIDYAVETDSFDSMRQAIIDRQGEIFLETPAYLTIRAKVPTLGACDFVLCRKDGDYKDGRHPSGVEVGTILDDLARRDFTCNAIAIDEEGNYLDPYGGRQDIEKKRLDCVGEAWTRFTEDGLRIIRALRFAVTKGFYLSPQIDELMTDEDFFTQRLRGVSIERVREELTKCFRHDTNGTIAYLGDYSALRHFLFSLPGLWLKPTTEKR